ncbi:hypothetical protein BH10PSE12_BH10PSE12_26870 [soil metagenome]
MSMPDEQDPNTGQDPDTGDAQPREVRDIVERLQAPSSNPVTRARIRVEQEVPPSRRGPGWDRHWRELEAYLEIPGEWGVDPE